jgi:hypothetical protein
MSDELSDEAESDADGPSRLALVEELERLNVQHEGPVTATMIRKVGKFSVSQYHDVFGNLRSAFKASDINREQQLREEIVRVWDLLGHRPSRAEMTEYGTVHVNSITHHLGRWDDICTELAQSSELPTTNEPAATQPGETSSNGDDTGGILDAVEADIEQDDR